MKKNYWKIKHRDRALLGVLIALVLGLVYPAAAQNRTVSGQILDEEANEPIPGATILVKGTTNGTITDLDGNYSINVPGSEAVLVISFVGYKSVEQTVGDRSRIDVMLPMDITSLEEVVVVGYGTQRKKVVTAATVQVKGASLQKRNNTLPMQALQGQAAGVSIRSNSGQPGTGMKVQIRGVGTIGNSSPLYMVDGIATSDISYLNSADIETIDVLKDAASAAIYGSRAANGVVLITTKKGSKGKAQISFDSYYGVQNRYKKVDLLNARQYAQIMNEQFLNSGGSVSNLPFDINNLPNYTGKGPANTNWLDQMFVKNAPTQNYTLGVNGGSDQGVYSLSFSYTGQAGVVGGAKYSNYGRYNARINTENKLFNDKLKLGENMTLTYTNKNGISDGNQYNNSLRSAFNTSPLLPVYDQNGNFFNTNDSSIHDQNGNGYWNKTEANPYASMVYNNQNATNQQKLVGNVYGELTPVSGLKIRSSFGVNLYNDSYRSFLPEYELSVYAFSKYSKVTQSMNRSRTIQFDNYATYDFSLGEHQFSAMVGTSLYDYSREYVSGTNANIAFSGIDYAWLNNTTNKSLISLISVNGGPMDATGYTNGPSKLLSYFGRMQYNFREKYLLSATFRADGSSRFAQGHRWGYFPSVSAGWVISDEGFLKSASVIEFWKLRASWGQNGNQFIPAFQYTAPITFQYANYNFGNQEGANTPGAYPDRLSNPNVKWETSEQIDIGTDLQLYSGKFNVTLDYYKKSTIGWLITAPILGTAGANPPVINGGKVINSGLEWELGYKETFRDLSFSLSVNGNYNKNLVKDVPTADGIVHGLTNQLYANAPEFYRAQSGHPIGYFWGYQTNGIFQSTSDVKNYTNADGKVIQPNAEPGDVKYVDQNGDGVLDNKDKVQIGNPIPKVNLGFTISLGYKALDFSVMAYGAFGQQLVQAYRSQSGKYSNYTTAILDRWTGEGTSNAMPRVNNSSSNFINFSDLYIQNGNFLRIGNVTLGYDFSKLLKVKAIGQLRLYAAVNNLWTFTKYTGMDPDVGYGVSNGFANQFASGIDLGFYPNPRTMLMGLNVKF